MDSGKLEREVRFHLDDLDTAIALMARMADLYPRLNKKQQGILLQTLAKQQRLSLAVARHT